MTPTVGSICTGYGGIEQALTLAGVGHELAWCSEIDPHASTVLTHRYPNIPNLGDIDYANPGPVDVITAGFPCQDVSLSGGRKGIGPDPHDNHNDDDERTRSGLWWRIRDVGLLSGMGLG